MPARVGMRLVVFVFTWQFLDNLSAAGGVLMMRFKIGIKVQVSEQLKVYLTAVEHLTPD